MKTYAIRLTGLAAIFASFALHAAEPVASPLPGYRLVWSDEFDGGMLDTNKWHYRTGKRVLSFQQPENVSVTNGLLRLALKKEKTGGAQYTAGGVISREQFKYGYYEARFRWSRITPKWSSKVARPTRPRSRRRRLTSANRTRSTRARIRRA